MPGEVVDNGQLNGAGAGYGYWNLKLTLEQPENALIYQCADPGHHLKFQNTPDMNRWDMHDRIGRYTQQL
jgi:hypothetical protein